jgi:hypothetical protein
MTEREEVTTMTMIKRVALGLAPIVVLVAPFAGFWRP